MDAIQQYYTPDNLDKDLKKELDEHDNRKYGDLLKQVEIEVKLATIAQQEEKLRMYKLLKLYLNQRRSDKTVGDTLFFTTHQTVLASLYDDEMMVRFVGRNDFDRGAAEHYNDMAKFDHKEMRKDVIDYSWDFDATFWGWGVVLMRDFERDLRNKRFVPVPQNLDPTTLLRDPRAIAINGIGLRGYKACKFWGWSEWATKRQMQENGNYFNLDELSPRCNRGTDDLTYQSQIARNEAQGIAEQFGLEESLGDNYEYNIFHWFTHWDTPEGVKKVHVCFTQDFKHVVRYEELEKDYWEAVDRRLFPISHDWRSISVADLVEDKQRARSVALNLGLDAMRSDLFPMYLYDTNRIVNKNQLRSYKFNKMIEVDGETGGAVTPFNKAQPNMQMVDYIMNVLASGAERATGATQLQQGSIEDTKRTATELQFAQQNTNKRYSLATKIFGWSEEEFYGRHYIDMYAEHFYDGIDEKIIRIEGYDQDEYRPVTKKELQTKLSLDVFVESKEVYDAKRSQQLQGFSAFVGIAAQVPGFNVRAAAKEFGTLSAGMTERTLGRFLPPSPDELIAREENERLNNGEIVEVRSTDDHMVHRDEHSKANDTPQARAHMRAHLEMLKVKEVRPDLFPQGSDTTGQQVMGAQQPGQQQPQVNPVTNQTA